MGNQGGEGGAASGSGRQPEPVLKHAHAEETIRANPSYSYWLTQTTEVIVAPLQPGTRMPLTVKPDGTILDGNTRVWVLRQRGYDVDSLPRVTYVPQSLGDFDG